MEVLQYGMKVVGYEQYLRLMEEQYTQREQVRITHLVLKLLMLMEDYKLKKQIYLRIFIGTHIEMEFIQLQI